MSEAASEGLSRTLVLNGLRELCDGPVVLADEESRDVLAEAFEAALHVAERDRFERTLDEGREDPDAFDDETQRFLRQCADDVLEELVDRGTRATLFHEATLSVAPREAAVYSFLASHDADALDRLVVGDAVREPLDAGAAAVLGGDFDAAVAAFDDAVTESGGGDGAVAARVLAGYACHRAGRDGDAIDYVEEALHFETKVWTAKLVGYAADHRFPEKFRDGKLAARAFFRWSTELPDVGDVTVSVGPAPESGPAVDALDPDGGLGDDSAELTGRDGCMPIDRLWPETTVLVALAGELPSIPSVESYYVATGVADMEVFEARSVEEVLLSGPAGDPRERVRLE